MSQSALGQPLLAFEHAPPFGVPVRFFIAASGHMVLAGGLLAIAGEAFYASRWSPTVLAVTHLLTLGVLMQTMLGALLQFLPVAVGLPVAHRAGRVAVLHGLLNLGALAMAAGFWLGERMLLVAGAGMVSSAVLLFFSLTWLPLWRMRALTPTLPALRWALVGLALTVCLGALLVSGYGYGAIPFTAVSLPLVTALHAGWGFVGWSAMLIVGVAFVVVPMFQLTRAYRTPLARALPLAMGGTLILWSMASLIANPLFERVAGTAAALAVLVFVSTTLRLQQTSKRPRPDVSARLWRVSLLCAALALGLWVAVLWLPETAPERALLVYWLGWIGGVGAVLGVVQGMLLKIVPFLAFMHVQALAQASGQFRVPHMGTYLAESFARRHLWVFIANLLGLIASVAWPAMTPLAGVMLAGCGAHLGWGLVQAVRRFRQERAPFLVASAG